MYHSDILVLSVIFCCFTIRVQAVNENTTAYATLHFRDGSKFAYWDNIDAWFDLDTTILQENSPQLLSLCVNGVWLLYTDKNFQTRNSADNVRLIYGRDSCIQLSSDFLEFKSMQPIESTSEILYRSSITLFTDKYFGSTGYTVRNEKDPFTTTANEVYPIHRVDSNTIASIRSLIMVGPSGTKWSLIDNHGRITCLTNSPTNWIQSSSERGLVCVLPVLASRNQWYTRVIGVAPGCPQERHYDFNVTNCLSSLDAGVLQNIDKSFSRSHDRSSSQMDEDSCTSDAKFSEEMQELAIIRMDHDFNSELQFLWPDDEHDVWKTEVLDSIFDVMLISCPERVMPSLYLKMIREFFVFRLNQIWKTEKSFKRTRVETNHLVHNLNLCYEKVTGSSSGNISQIILEKYKRIHSTHDFLASIHSSFFYEDSYDPVIETTWVVANHVAAICSAMLEDTVHFWTHFVNIINDIYFNPLIHTWKRPTEPNVRQFKHILGGYNVQRQFKRAAFCATSALHLVPNLVPFQKFNY